MELRLIQRLKSAYLPLKEIRRRLAGLSDDDVHALMTAENERGPAMMEEAVSYDASLAEAREYLSLLESGERYRTEPMRLAMPAAPDPPSSTPTVAKFTVQPELAS